MKTIVVGVDGSACADGALEFALEEAALRGASLHIVCAWQLARLNAEGVYGPETLKAFPAEAQTVVHKALARAAGLHPAVPCEGKLLQGPPADVLLEEARGAALIVVGSHGRGGFAGFLLGSVSQQVVRHASCPVVVVRQTAAS